MDIAALITEYKPLILKMLVGALTAGVILGAKKLGLQLSGDEAKSIAGLGGSIIIGIGLHYAAKTHATISNQAPPAAVPPAADVQKPG